jgi:mannose-6-phosphate isomerase
MGAHPLAPSVVVAGDHEVPLDQLIEQRHDEVLGKDADYRTLPFLMKILSAARSLSIQAHPNKEQAEQGFAREQKRGTPIDSPLRTYKDDNHKPELVCALTTFHALLGFRKPQAILQDLRQLCPNSLKHELETFEETKDIKWLFESLMSLGTKNTNLVLMEAVHKATRRTDEISHWITTLGNTYNDDIGVLAPAYLNLVTLKPGQAFYVDAGMLHSWLQGTIVELETNSDNVVRGGLTEKHNDIPELIKILNFSESHVSFITPTRLSATEHVYKTHSQEFQLSVIQLSTNKVYHGREKGPVEILLCTKGSGRLHHNGQELDILSGTTVLVPADSGKYEISGSAFIYKATVPHY